MFSLALGGVQLEAAVVQAFLQIFGEGLRGFVGAADGPIVEVQLLASAWITPRTANLAPNRDMLVNIGFFKIGTLATSTPQCFHDRHGLES